MENTNQKLLASCTSSQESITDILGYFEYFDGEDSGVTLCAVKFSFGNLALFVVAQEDDSFRLYQDGWCPDPKWTSCSLMESAPWSLVKGKSLLWSWVLFNQQGYLDGLQLEFANNSEDQSIVLQLVAIGCEVKQRIVGYKVKEISPYST